MIVVYLGYNSFTQHKRGVENVIDFQSKSYNFSHIYYLHWGSSTHAYKFKSFTSISIKHCWYWPLILNIVLRKIRSKGKFIIHSHNPLFSFCSIYSTDILTVHDGLFYLNRSKRRKFTLHFFIVEHLVYFRCTLVHFISNFTKEQSLFGKRKNFVLIYNTSHLEDSLLASDNRIFNSTQSSILVVRSIEERARIDLLLEVAEECRNKNYYFTVAGKGPLLEFFQNEIRSKQLQNISLLGYVIESDLIKLYSTHSLVLLLAEYGEGFGLPIIEGYLFNKPVIASNRCAIPEIIIDNAFLFENRTESIIEKIDFALNYRKLNYREYYLEKFSNIKILDEFRDMYININK